MNWVKYLFGVFIMLMAVYYLSLAYRGWLGGTPVRQGFSDVVDVTVTDGEKWKTILGESRRDGRPVFVDFWATWCKNCEAMERTTFRDATVSERLSRYRVVRFQVENLTDASARAVTDYFEIKGLPTYLVVSPEKGGP
jgi:thiol:disulfide interchange protein